MYFFSLAQKGKRIARFIQIYIFTMLMGYFLLGKRDRYSKEQRRDEKRCNETVNN